MTKDDIAKRLIKNDSLFSKIHVIQQQFDILPSEKEHIGACIKYQDLAEMRAEFIHELVDSVLDWVYSTEKYKKMISAIVTTGKSEAGANSELLRKAHQKFRTGDDSQLLIQGQLGELLLFHFIQRCFRAVPILRKMTVLTSSDHERFGADAIHYKVDSEKNIIILGEAKTYVSSYQFNTAFARALDSILDTYKKHKDEINLYVHEDFLDDEMNKVAESYLNGTLDKTEVHLVSIIIYNETQKLKITNQEDILAQIEQIIAKRFSGFDKSKIDLEQNPILKRITYIAFPIWDLEQLAKEFKNLI